MPGRILGFQRQLKELGRLRAGLTETGTTKDGKKYERPTSSKTWILTSANRRYLDAAARLWGGDVLEWQPVGNGPKAWRLITSTPLIDAILPPGDPLSQYQEMWSRGGCQRRCNGEQEMLSGNPCLCRAQFGDDFHEQKVGTVCDIHTRLNVSLPDLPDIGMWRIETKGFWPANHIAGYVDMIKGLVGPQVLVPIRLHIEPRTKIKDGKTSQFIEIVVELRSQATFAQILETPQVLAIGGPADSRIIEGAPARTAIEAAPEPTGGGHQPGTPAQWRQRFTEAKTLDELRSMWTLAGNDGALDDQTRAAYKAAGERLLPSAPPIEAMPDDTPLPAEAPAVGVVDWAAEFAKATTMEELRALWTACGKAGALADNKPAWFAESARVRGAAPAEPVAQPAAAPVVEGDVEPDRDDMWGAILRLGGERGWNMAETKRQYQQANGTSVEDADGWAMQLYRDALKNGLVSA